MDIVRLFDWWRLLITPEKPGWRKRVESGLLGTKPFCCFLVFFLPTTFLGALNKGLSMKAVMACRLPISLMPCFAAGCLFAFKREAMQSFFNDAILLSSQLCAGGVPEESDVSSRFVLKFSRIGYRNMHTWTIAAALCIPVTVFFQGKPLIEMWPWFDGDLGLWLSCTLQTVIVYPMAFPVYAVSIYIWSVVEALAVLFRIVASQLAEASTYRQIKGVHFPSPRCTVAFVHVQLVSLSGRFAQQIELVLTILTIGILLTPALSTVMIVRGSLDLFCFASTPFLVAFWLLCRAGQNLENASFCVTCTTMDSFSKVQSLDKNTGVRSSICRALLIMMAMSMKKQSITAFRSSIRYNLRTCHQALRTWYSILQYLLNMPDSSDSETDV